jgi:hypothetical protein
VNATSFGRCRERVEDRAPLASPCRDCRPGAGIQSRLEIGELLSPLSVSG